MSSPSLKAQDWFDSRAHFRDGFLQHCGWADVPLEAVGEDCAFRRYFRLQKDGRSAVLMEAVPDGSERATPGHKIGDYVRIAGYLRDLGLNAPKIYEVDVKTGYMLLEDMGDLSFKAALDNGIDKGMLYLLATDVLRALYQKADCKAIELPDYYKSHVHKGHRRLVDWYMPSVRQSKNPDGLVDEYLFVWSEIEKSLPPCPQGFVHIDYHVENMMYLPERDGLQKCALLDFQGGMAGPLPYDLANLLEDVRVDVPLDIRSAMLGQFCAGMEDGERAAFNDWYRVLATQFHCRVAGQFIKLAVHDDKGRYLAYLPRVCGYLREGLQHPVLKPLSDWFEEQGMDFRDTVIDPISVSSFIRDDAF